MQAYEAMREVYDACTGRWEVDGSFTRDVRGQTPDQAMQSWFHGRLPPHRRSAQADGSVTYQLDPPVGERYLFSALC